MITSTAPKYDLWILGLIFGTPAATLVLGIVLIVADGLGAGVGVLAVSVLTGLLCWSVVPRKYEIRPDMMRVVLGWPFALSVPFSAVAEIRPARWSNTLAHSGLRFATSVKTPVLVARRRGWDIVISPKNRQEFVDAASHALSGYRQEDTPNR